MAENSKKTVKKRRGPGRPFPKGKSGNPGGRPHDTLTPHLREIAATGKGKQVAERLYAEALNGNVQAIAILLDRLDGKPKQQIDLSVQDRKRELVERAIEALMADAEIDRDQAIAELSRLTPEIREWIN